jgi:hypothetical protein
MSAPSCWCLLAENVLWLHPQTLLCAWVFGEFPPDSSLPFTFSASSFYCCFLRPRGAKFATFTAHRTRSGPGFIAVAAECEMTRPSGAENGSRNLNSPYRRRITRSRAWNLCDFRVARRWLSDLKLRSLRCPCTFPPPKRAQSSRSDFRSTKKVFFICAI